MPKTRDTAPAWLTLSTATRLFLPMLLLIAVVGTVRYQLLVRVETRTAEAHFAQQVQLVQKYLLPALALTLEAPQPQPMQAWLRNELRAYPDVAVLQWRAGSQRTEARNPAPTVAHYPAWFGTWLGIGAHTAELEAAGHAGTLTVQISPVFAFNSAWSRVQTQLWIAVGSVLTILGLLVWVLRTNRRMLQRLAVATQQFQHGDLATRMQVAGPLEARTLAHTFNNMADEVQSLVASLTQTQTALQIEKERAEVTLSSIGDAVITTDLAGRIHTLNAVAQQLTGWTQQQALGHPLAEVFELQEEPGWAAGPAKHTPLYQTTTVVHATHQTLLHPSGERIAIETTAAPIRQADGTAVGCVLVFRDVSEKRQLIQEISWQIGHDVLTGLHNRAAMEEPFNLAILQARHHHKLLAVCLLDLDHFQPINTRYGSSNGDRLLQQVAQRLAEFAGDDHGLARLGGDEFVLLLKDQHDLAEVQRHVDQVQALLSAPYPLDEQTVHLTTSIGIAVTPRDDTRGDTNLDTLLRHADQAMVQAKQTGRNRSHLFDAQRDQEVQTHHHQRTRIHQALLDGELRLYYQPKLNMRTGSVFGMEALLRWQHPEQGVVGPYHFLPLVEHTDLIIDIGEWVLHQALQQMQQWAALGRHWVVSVNIAARHFHRPDFVARLGSILACFPQVSPSMLELEILESAALEDVQHMRSVMAACQQLGVQFALDDFGTGYSSLAYLKRLPANTLKIDQAFVRDMLEDPDDLTLVEAVVGLAKAFNRKVIAEGVETVEHGLLLLQLGCDLAQGYGIARPMPADTVAAWATDFIPGKAWRAWGATQWDTADFPLLLAEHDHHAWVAHIAARPADAEAHYPARFGNWYAQRGNALYGHLPAFAAVGTAILRLRDHSQVLAKGPVNGQAVDMQGLNVLHAALTAQLATLLQEATQKQASRRAAQNFMVYS
ncbi:putative bifunctional diguanylate cyclase/phosphodiesterase [Rhodoferax sp. WC2427]|uniref:putative bifunctional diguanylate cyclase/phosphodiesterase n=1 Tax=Rhodoferax sp. WC2427 TaxID=3234144 RepID=UPI00346556AF